MSPLTLWLSLQLVVAALWLVSVWAVRAGGPRSNRSLRGIALLAFVVLVMPTPTPPVERLVPLQVADGGWIATATRTARAAQPYAEPVASAALSLTPFLIAGMVLLLCIEVLRSLHTVRTATLLHRQGSIRLAVANIATPRTIWLGVHWILLDPDTAKNRQARLLAIRHEAQHIRHGDTLFAWFSAALVAACAPNPAAWWFAHNLSELDEHAVDHALVHTHGVSPKAYGKLLLSTASSRPSILSAAPGLSPKTPLHRRLSMLTSSPATRPFAWLLASCFVGGIALARPTLPSPDYDSAIEAASTSISIPDSQVVRDAYTRLTEDPRGAAFLERALANRSKHSAFIRSRLAEAGLPLELEAVVLIESAYDDQLTGDPVESSAPGSGGAGLWMFIPSTARTYGLEVSHKLDQRYDRDLETDAAIALLSDLHDEFGDWGLALAAYNQGPTKVHKAIRNHGTRDLPTLIEAGALNRYVPMVWAGMLVISE